VCPRFLGPRSAILAPGYDAAEVDELLACVAAELDAGRACLAPDRGGRTPETDLAREPL